MTFKFEINTQVTVAARVAEQKSKREVKAATSFQQEESTKKRKLSVGTSHTTSANSTKPESSPDALNQFPENPLSTSTSRSSTPIYKNPRSRDLGGRPRERPLVIYKKFKAPTRLRKDHPVKAGIPIDIWQGILAYCPPRFLLKARTVCSIFKAALSYESTWKVARRRHFGSDVPDPPPGLSEMQYADLLDGVGCQSRGCDGQARRTYWGFQRRWCEECLVKNLVLEGEISHIQYLSQAASRYIPQAKFDSWCHYQWVGDYEETPAWAKSYPGSQKIMYGSSAVKNLQNEIIVFMRLNKTDEEKEVWFTTKEAANKAFVDKLQEVEAWCETHRLGKMNINDVIKKQRATYYKEQARSIGMDPDALALCPAFMRAVRISTPPTQRTWQQLLAKIKDERSDAEAELRGRQRRAEIQKYRDQLAEDYRANLQIRANKSSVEQKVVLALADEVVSGLIDSPNPTADTDLIHIILRGVFKAYQAHVPKPKCKNGSDYRLIMDDARMVYEMKVKPIYKRLRDPIRNQRAKLVKCPCCQGTNATISFELILQHMYDEHRYDGCFSFFGVTNSIYMGHDPWYRAEWPRNLPILADHHEATGKWNPDDDSEYKCKEPTSIPAISEAFNRRGVDVKGPIPTSNFVVSIVYAAKKLRCTTLPSQLQALIVMEYARCRYEYSGKPPLSVEYLREMQSSLETHCRGDLFDGFCCLRCHQKNQATEFKDHPHTFAELSAHYVSRHDEQHWMRNMFHFPPALLLWTALESPENKNAKAIFDQLFPALGAMDHTRFNDSDTHRIHRSFTNM